MIDGGALESIDAGLGVAVSVGLRLVFVLLLARVAWAIVRAIARDTTKAREARAARYFWPCGQLDYERRPCMLPRGHISIEHATAWQAGEGSFDERHRWDESTVGEGRTEKRYTAGFIGTVTADGDRGPETIGKPVE